MAERDAIDDLVVGLNRVEFNADEVALRTKRNPEGTLEVVIQFKMSPARGIPTSEVLAQLLRLAATRGPMMVAVSATQYEFADPRRP